MSLLRMPLCRHAAIVFQCVRIEALQYSKLVPRMSADADLIRLDTSQVVSDMAHILARRSYTKHTYAASLQDAFVHL